MSSYRGTEDREGVSIVTVYKGADCVAFDVVAKRLGTKHESLQGCVFLRSSMWVVVHEMWQFVYLGLYRGIVSGLFSQSLILSHRYREVYSVKHYVIGAVPRTLGLLHVY